MTDNTTQSAKRRKQPKQRFDANHPYHPDYTGDSPMGIASDADAIAPQVTALAPEHISEKELHAHDQGRVNAEQSQSAEQRLKTQQREQNDRSVFLKGNAQEHQQGNKHK